MTDRLVALEATRVDADLLALGALRTWLDSWRGVGAVERGMGHQRYDLQLTRYNARVLPMELQAGDRLTDETGE